MEALQTLNLRVVWKPSNPLPPLPDAELRLRVWASCIGSLGQMAAQPRLDLGPLTSHAGLLSPLLPRYACVLSRCSGVRLCATPWTVACQAPLSVGFSRQEYRSRLTFPSPKDPPNPGIEPTTLTSPASASRVLYHWLHLGSPTTTTPLPSQSKEAGHPAWVHETKSDKWLRAWSWSQSAQVQIPAPPLSGCLCSAQLPNSSTPQSSYL